MAIVTERRPRVLVFDSGVGGFSVAECIHHQLPGAEMIYLADNALFPYGDQPAEVVIERCCRLIGRVLTGIPCDVVVVACNTASTVVLPRLRQTVAAPVVGVVPAIKPAVAVTRNHRIGLLATPATVRRPYLDELVRQFASGCEVVRVGHPALVRWAEELVAGTSPDQVDVNHLLEPLREAGVDTVVLGCTHYPLLLPWLREGLPGHVHWLDSGKAIARRVAYLLDEQGQGMAAAAPMTPERPVIREALFTGKAPTGLADFLEARSIPVGAICGEWGTV